MSRLLFALLVGGFLLNATQAQAQLRFYRGYYYPSYYAPAGPAFTPAVDMSLVRPGETLTWGQSKDLTTPTVAVHAPGVPYIAWLQWFNGVWNRIENQKQNGDGDGVNAATLQAIKSQVDNNSTKLDTLQTTVNTIQSRLPGTIVTPPPGAPGAPIPKAGAADAAAAANDADNRFSQSIIRLNALPLKK